MFKREKFSIKLPAMPSTSANSASMVTGGGGDATQYVDKLLINSYIHTHIQQTFFLGTWAKAQFV